jgi:hypothetical protein
MTEFRTAGGDVLTDEIIEELADEAERGYDLSKATQVTYGRPSLGRCRRLPTSIGTGRPRVGRRA